MASEVDANFWDKASEKYSKAPITDLAGYERTLDATSKLLSPDDTVLELGCGTGGTAIRLAPNVRSCLGTDISAKMIDLADEKKHDKKDTATPPGLNFRVATVELLAAETERFSAVVAFNYLHLVRDMPGTLRDIHTVLAPGGIFISKTPCLRDMTAGVLMFALLPVMRALGKAPHVAIFSAAELERQIVDAGFEIAKTELHASGGKDTRPFIIARKKVE